MSQEEKDGTDECEDGTYGFCVRRGQCQKRHLGSTLALRPVPQTPSWSQARLTRARCRGAGGSGAGAAAVLDDDRARSPWLVPVQQLVSKLH